MSTVFVDTSALLPLIDRDDSDHEAVVAAVEKLVASNATLLTSSYTLVESGALVRRRLGVGPFRALGRVAKRALEVVWVDADLHEQAWVAAAKQKTGPSLVDHVAFIIMTELSLDTALTLDRHFRRQGFHTLP